MAAVRWLVGSVAQSSETSNFRFSWRTVVADQIVSDTMMLLRVLPP